MLQYLPPLISITVAACMSLASYEIFDSFDEVNPASSEMTRISLEPRNTTKPPPKRPKTTLDAFSFTDLPMLNSTEATLSKWVQNNTEFLINSNTTTIAPLNASTIAFSSTSMMSTEGTTNMTITVTEGLVSTSMATTEGLAETGATTESTLRVTVGYSRRKADKINQQTTTAQPTAPPLTNLTVPPDTCPEEEQPSNIGPYEVPSQKDVVLHVRRILLHMFRSYHKKTLEVLKDMKEATKSSWPKEERCQGASKLVYRRCVRTVSNRCELAAKSLVLALEELRGDVLGLLQGKVCNIEDMNADPIQLIRILAMEKVSLEFALPGFLRLLNACAGHCSKFDPTAHSRKPLRHVMLSDQDLVIRHFLTQKSYSRLLKGIK